MTAAMPRRAMTLAEMMVVLAILMVVGLMVFWSVQAVLGLARAAACQNNLRQIGLSVSLYANDWDGRIPAERNRGILDAARSPAWFNRLPQYVDRADVRGRNSVFQCPLYVWTNPEIFDHASPKSLKMNARFDALAPHHYVQGSSPVEVDLVLFIDGVAGETGMGQWGYCVPSGVDELRHRGRPNLLYADLHTAGGPKRPKDRTWADLVRWTSPSW